MQKDIRKIINIAVKLNYTETCNLLKGGIICADFHIADFIYNGCLDDIEDEKINGLQFSMHLDEDCFNLLEFMRAYLTEKEKYETR